MQFRHLLGQARPSPPDRQVLPFNTTQHADFSRPTGPEGPIISPYSQKGQAGISRARVFRGSPPRICLPITDHILEVTHHSLATSASPEKLVLWALAALAFFGFFHLGELLPDLPSQLNPPIHLAWGDVAVDNHTEPRMIQFHLKVSKRDQLGAV